MSVLLVSLQDRESQIAAIESTFDAAQRPVSIRVRLHMFMVLKSNFKLF